MIEIGGDIPIHKKKQENKYIKDTGILNFAERHDKRFP